MNQRRTSDTLPRPGRVNQVCKEWLVLEDGALAYQLQQEEVTRHLSDNKQRNATVREDFPHALQLQRQAEEEATKLAVLAEERDRKLAQELASQLVKKQPRPLPKLVGDMNVVGLPLPLPPRPASPPPSPNYYEICPEPEEEETWPPPPPPEVVDISKEEQERKDMELAARLQLEEELSEDLDRRLAIEAQDEELARLLQEKEKLRARRARERAKARRLQAASPSPSPSPSLPLPIVSSSPLPSRGNEIPNIAMAIDPTYQRLADARTGNSLQMSSERGRKSKTSGVPPSRDLLPPKNLSSPRREMK